MWLPLEHKMSGAGEITLLLLAPGAFTPSRWSLAIRRKGGCGWVEPKFATGRLISKLKRLIEIKCLTK